MPQRDPDTTARLPAFTDARDLHGPHAGLPLSDQSLLLLARLGVCAQRLKTLDLPQAPLAPLPTGTVAE